MAKRFQGKHQSTQKMEEGQRINLWLPAVAIIILLFVNNWAIPLWNADEAAYAGLASNMLKTGDWLNQWFYWSEIHRKPPLHLWLTAISMSIFGVNEWAVRFFSSVFMISSAYLLFNWTKQHFGVRAGVLASMIMVTNMLMLALGKIGFTDSTLILCEIVSGFSLLAISQNPSNRKALFLFWVGLAVGMLTKGPQILIPFSVLVLAMSIFKMDRQIIVKIKPWFGIPLSLLPILLWGYLSWQKDDGEFVMWLIDWYILKRAGGSVLGQSGPPGYYFVVLLASFFLYFTGWVGVLRKMVLRSFKTRSIEGYLIFWSLAAWIPFELIPSKLPHYASGAIPPMSILIAISLLTVSAKTWKSMWMRISVFVQLLLSAVIASALVYLVQEQFGFRGILTVILTGLVPIIAVIVYIIRIETNEYRKSAFALAWGGLLFGMMVFLPLMNVMMPIFSGPKEIEKAVGYEISNGEDILLAKKEHHLISLPFYLSRQGHIEESWGIPHSITRATTENFQIVIGDSTLAAELTPEYSGEKIPCFDINSGTYKDYYVLIKE